MKRVLLSAGACALVMGVLASPPASAQQSFNLYVGGFTPRPIDARGDNDVLFQNSYFLTTYNRQSSIDMGQFNNATVGGEWLVMLNRNVEAGLGLGVYQKTVPTVYSMKGYEGTGADIPQSLKLRIVPFTATLRLYPWGTHAAFQPYLGAGVAVYAWHYSEFGQFVNGNNDIVSGVYTADGGAVGPVVLGGVRIPLSQTVGIGGEIRWQGGEATLPADKGFAGSRLELAGMNYLFLVNVKF